MKRPLMGLGIALAVGVAAGWSGVSWMILGVMMIMAGILLKKWTNSSYKYLLGLFVFFVVGLCRTMMISDNESHIMEQIQGTIYQIQEKEKVYYLFMKVQNDRRVLVVTEKSDIKGRKDENNQKEEAPYYKGQVYWVQGEAEVFEKSGNPGQFDEKYYYQSQGVDYRIWAEDIKLLSEGDRLYQSFRWLEDLKEMMCRFYDRYMTDKGSGILKAAVLGERGELDRDLKRYYQENGWMHLITTSGLHLSFIAMAVYKRLRKITVPIKTSTIAALILMTAYGYMTDFGNSMIRAMGMMVLGLMAVIFGRRTDTWTSLVLLAGIMMFLRPERLLSVGFILTYAAVGGMELGKWLSKQWMASKPNRHELRVKKRCVWIESIWIQVGIFAATLPVLLCSMYEIPMFGFFYNFFMIPLISIIVPAAFVAGIFGVLNLPVLKQGAVLILKIIDQVFMLIHRLPSKVWTCGCPENWQVVLFCAAIILVIWCFRQNKSWPGLIILIMSCCMLMFVRFRTNQVIFMDVGQGDGICVLTDTGQAALIDGGSSDVRQVFEYRIRPLLKYYGIRRIDAWFLTHGDMDHVSGIEEALKTDVDIGRIFLPDVIEDEVLMNIQNNAEEKNMSVQMIKTGDTVLMEDFKLQCMYPLKELCTGDKNNDSMVLKISCTSEKETIDILLTGDIEEKGENILMKYVDLGKADILKIAHHGSSGGTSALFLQEVQPEWAIISCGKDNHYGHPHAETLQRLKDADCRWLSTAVQGAVCVEMDRKGYTIFSYAK